MELQNGFCRKGVERPSSSNFPAVGRGHLPALKAPLQPSLKHFLGWDIHNFSWQKSSENPKSHLLFFSPSIYSLLSCQYRFQKMERLLIFQLLHNNAGKCAKQRKLIPQSNTASVDLSLLFQLSIAMKLTPVTGFVNLN